MEYNNLQKGEVFVTDEKQAILSAKSLGAALAACVKDPEHTVTGMAVILLPKLPSSESVTSGMEALDAVNGLQKLFRDALSLGARRETLKVWLVGATQFMEAPKDIAIGAQVYTAVRQILKQNRIKITNEHVGGQQNRSIILKAGGVDGPEVRLEGEEEIKL